MLGFVLTWGLSWLSTFYVLKRDKVGFKIIKYYFIVSLLIGTYFASLPNPDEDEWDSLWAGFGYAILSFPVVALCGWILKRIYLAVVFRKAKDILVSSYVIISLSTGIYTASLPYTDIKRGGNIALGVGAGSFCFLVVALVGSIIYHVCLKVVSRIIRRKQSSA